MAGTFDWSFRAQGAREAGVLLGILEKLDNILDVITQKEQKSAQAFAQFGSVFTKIEQSIAKVANTLQMLQQVTENVTNTVTNYQQKFDNSIRTNNTFKNIVDQSTSTVNKFSTSIKDSTVTQKRYEDSVDQSVNVQHTYQNQIDNSVKAHAKYDNRVDNSVTVINKFSGAQQRAQRRVSGLFRTLTRAAGVWNTWNKAVDFAVKRIRQFTGLMTGWESKLRDIGGSFERSEATLRVLAEGAGSTGTEIDKLVETVKGLGRETEFSAGQAADGAITLLKAGNDASQAIGKLEGALESALATGLDFGKAAKVGNYAWQIFGDNLGKTGDLTQDYTTALKVMIASANSADVSVEQLAGSLTNGGNILADMGVSLTRTTTALGLLANRGIVGNKAMRLLSISVKRLVDGTAPAKRALEELGVAATDERGQLRDLGVLMEELGTRLDLRNPSEQIKLMKDLFGAGDKVMRTLLDAGIEGFNQLEGTIEQALGTMGKLKEAKVDTIVGAWKQFRSAVEGVWVELVAVLRVPVMEYWNTLASVLRKVSEHINTVGQRFKENAGNLTEWIDLIKQGGIEGLFQGLSEELEPEIQKLESLWEAFTQTVGALLQEIWEAFLNSSAVDRIKEFAKTIGVSLLDGIKAGMGEGIFEKLLGLAGTVSSAVGAVGRGIGVAQEVYKYSPTGLATEAAASLAEWQGERRQIQTLEQHLEKMKAKKQEVLDIPLIEMTDEEHRRMSNINKQIEVTTRELEKLQGKRPKIAPELTPPDTSTVQAAAKKTAQTYTEAFMEQYGGETGSQQDELQALWDRQIQEAQQVEAERQQAQKQAQEEQARLRAEVEQKRASQSAHYERERRTQADVSYTTEAGGRAELEAISQEELKAKQEILNTQQQLTEEEHRYKEAVEQSKNIINETNVAINEISSNFEQWMINPVNVFQQKLLQVKETFGDMIDSFQKKKIDLGEQFGLTTSEDAMQQRRQLAEESLKRDERLLELAQTPEEEMRIQERMAERAAGIAEMAEGPEQQQYARRAQEFLDKAASSAAESEDMEIKRLEIQQEYARKNLAEYENMVQQAETAGGRAASLELAQQAYMALGPEYVEKAARATEELKVSKAEAATEEAERRKLIAENSSIQVELLNRMVELGQEQLNAFRTRAQIPQNPEYASDTG